MVMKAVDPYTHRFGTLPGSQLARMRSAAAHLDGQFVLAIAQIDDMA
jgi:hypothetical protein